MNTNSSIPRRQFIKQTGQAALAAAAASSSFAVLGQAAAPTLTFGIAGVAHIHTPNYLQILQRRPDVKVKCVWDHDAARAGKAAAGLNCKTVDDPKAIWDDPEIKAVVILAETNRHHDLVIPAAKAHKHIFAEKPLGINAQESYEMAEAMEKAGVLFNTGYFMRTEPGYLYMKQQVEQGVFGKITRVRGSNCHSGSLRHWFDTDWRWMADPKIAGVGAFGDLGTRSLDILMWMFGDVSAITADIKVVTGNYGDCDESGEALMKFKSGITGTLGAGWVDAGNTLPFYVSGTQSEACILGSMIIMNGRQVTALPERLAEPMEQFVDAVGGKNVTTLVKPREAAMRVSVMESAYKGAAQQVWMKPV
jgi:predicted dehydrogenase